uniref:M96 mating-specific protein family n=1 Tax=Phytophthora ramorum TaxID=164328 RepID=H3GPV5_PHYRM
MSQAVTDSEGIMTVEEAIAIIDSFDVLLGDSDNGNNVSSPTCSDSGTVHLVTNTKNAPKRKRKANPPGYTTRVQQRKKAELLGLREQVRALEQEVDQLKRKKPNPASQKNTLDPRTAAQHAKWGEVVAMEYNERRLSEETNCKLKQILAHQAEVDKKLRGVLFKRSLLQGFEFVFGNEPTSTYSFAAFENNKSIVDHLEQKVVKLYLDSGSVFQTAGPPPSVSCSMQMKHDKVRGMTAEALSTTPMLCPMEVAADICWKDLSIPRSCPEKWARCVKGNEPNSHEKNWILTLQCPSYVKQVKGVQFLRKFQEPNRIVIIKADLMMLNNEGLQFRDQTWTIITRSETNPEASVVRVCEQMYLDQNVGIDNARPEDVRHAQSVVLRNLSWKLREHTTHLQDQLIEETQRFGMASAVAGF